MEEVRALAGADERPVLTEVIDNYQTRFPSSSVSDLAHFLDASFEQLRALYTCVRTVQRRATQNQSTYLTWDHMDVYFATSMRKPWEYKDFYDFVESVMSASELKELDIRYFDPTQSFTDNRINKGLVEALMLRRARCTVYSVQDTDTLGKDSELASTLAQGKTVIAYVPDVVVETRTCELLAEDVGTILERLRFILYADENLPQRLSDEQLSSLGRVRDRLDGLMSARVWLSVPDEDASDSLKSELGPDLEEFCRIIALSERVVYDRRATTLRESHPLAIQVNLGTGVANGVLVVRTIPDCAALLRRVLLFGMDFDLEEKDGMWYLRERISGCIFRVVTSDRKLSNCFWNFYLR